MARVFISYRHGEPDQTVARRCYEDLDACGHDVFFDGERINTGERWDQGIGEALDAAEWVVVFVSSSSMASEYILERELRPAVKRLDTGSLTGLVQVNLAYDGLFPPDIRDSLAAVQYVKWHGHDDTPLVLEKIARALPAPDVLIRGVQSFERTDGRAFATLGREREIAAFMELLGAPEHRVILLHGVSGAGKTSFLRAGIAPRATGLTIAELESDRPEEVEVLARGGGVVVLDQFEQTLVRLAEHEDRIEAFAGALERVVETRSARLVLSVRDELRTAFDTMFPRLSASYRRFALLPFDVTTAAAVLGRLLASGRVEYDEKFLVPLCESLADGVPRTVSPAMLQLVAQHCAAAKEPLTAGAWQRLRTAGADLFELHVRQNVLERLPSLVSQIAATKTLVALTAGNVKSPFHTAKEIAVESGVAPGAVAKTLTVAAAASARVVIVDEFDPQHASRFRLVHDLFVEPIRRLHARAGRRRERMRVAGVVAVMTLLPAAALLGLGRARLAERQTQRQRAETKYVRSLAEGTAGRSDMAALLLAEASATTDGGDPLATHYALRMLHTLAAIPRDIIQPAGKTSNVWLSEYSTARWVVRDGHSELWDGRRHIGIKLPDKKETGKVEFLPGGRWILDRDAADVWIDARDGRAVPTPLPIFRFPIRSSQDGAVAGEDHSLRMFFAVPGLGWVPFAKDYVPGGFGHLLGREAFVSRAGNDLAAFDLKTGARLTTYALGEHDITGWSFNADDSRVTAYRSSPLSLAQWKASGERIAAGVFSSNDIDWALQRIAAGEFLRSNDTIGSPSAWRKSDQPPAEIRMLDVAADGRTLLAVGEQVLLWDPSKADEITGTPLRLGDLASLGQPLGSGLKRKGDPELQGLPIRFSRDGRNNFVAVQRGDAANTLQVRAWTRELRPAGPVVTLPPGTRRFVISQAGDVVRAATGDWQIFEWPLAGAPFGVTTRPGDPDDFDWAGFQYYSPRHRLRGRFLRRWQKEGLEIVDAHGKVLNKPIALTEIQDIAISPDGRTLSILHHTPTGSFVECVTLSDGKRNRCSPEIHPGGVHFAGDADRFVEADDGDTVTLISTRDATAVFEATLNPDSTVKPAGLRAILRPAADFVPEQGGVTIVLPSGARLRLVSKGADVSVVDLQRNVPLLLPRGIDYYAAVLSPDGHWLALLMARGSKYRSFLIWDLWTGRPLIDETPVYGSFESAKFTEDGSRLLVLESDGVIEDYFVGAGAHDPAEWPRLLATVATGKKLDGDIVNLISQDEYDATRKRLLAVLRREAPSDPNAAELLRRLGPR